MMWRACALALLVLLAGAAVPAVRHLRERPPAPPATVRGALTGPPAAELGAGDDVLDAAMAPDGREMVFVATSGGTPALWRRSFDGDAAILIPGTTGAALPAWSRTGDRIAFFADGTLKEVGRAGGTARALADAAAPAGAAWLRDDSLLFAPTGRGPLRRLRGGTDTPATTLRPGDRGHVFPAAVGDGVDFLYVAVLESGRRAIRVVAAGEERDVARTSGHADIVGDTLVHVIEGTLSAQPLDAATRQPAGRATPLAFGVGVSATGHGSFAVSPRIIAWGAAAARGRQLAWLDLQGRRLATVGEPADYWQVRLSPDDRRVAVTMLDPLLRTLDIFVRPLSAPAQPRRLSLQLSPDTDPVWAPDGTRVLFRSLRGGRPDLVTRPFEFSEAEDVVVVGSELDETASDWRSGQVLFQAPGNGTGLDIWAVDTATGRRTDVVRGGFNESDARWSPDGRLLAYVSDEPGQPDIFVQPWPGGERRFRVTQAGGTRPRWGRDGGLFFLRGGWLMRVGIERRGSELVFGEAVRLADLTGARDYDLARGSDRVLAVLPVARAEAPAAGLIVDWASSVLAPAAPRR